MTETTIQNAIINSVDREDKIARIVNVVHRPGGGINVAIRSDNGLGLDLLVEGNGRVEIATVQFPDDAPDVTPDGLNNFNIVSINGAPSITIVFSPDALQEILFDVANVEVWNAVITLDNFGNGA